MDQNPDIPSHSLSNSESTQTRSGQNTFVCSYEDCSKIFKAKKSLIDHTRIHSGEKPYSCHFSPCGKAFTQYSSLQKHERIHKGEKPYNCESCGQSFTQVSNLKRHERSHKGERPHGCDVCSKTFTTSSNLKQHQQTHQQKDTREKFECQACGKIYNYNSSLKKHLLEHGIEMPKKEAKDGNDLSPPEVIESTNKSIDKYQISSINLGNFSTMGMGEQFSLQNDKSWNTFSNFQMPSFPQNDLEILQGFQTNLIFSELLQFSQLGRGSPCGESLNMKRPMHIEDGALDKYEPKPGKRLYKHNHHHHMHSLTCEHLMIIHQGHVDYLHDGKLHHVTDSGCLEEHELEISEQNPILCKEKEQCSCDDLPKNIGGHSYSAEKKKLPALPSTQTSDFNSKRANQDFSQGHHPQHYHSHGKGSSCIHRNERDTNSNFKEDFCSLINHIHSEICEHPMIIHNGHIDYIVEGHLHHVHDGHCDNHGPVMILDKFTELQRVYQMGSGIRSY